MAVKTALTRKDGFKYRFDVQKLQFFCKIYINLLFMFFVFLRSNVASNILKCLILNGFERFQIFTKKEKEWIVNVEKFMNMLFLKQFLEQYLLF